MGHMKRDCRQLLPHVEVSPLAVFIYTKIKDKQERPLEQRKTPPPTNSALWHPD